MTTRELDLEIPCPQKLHFFIWLATHEKLPTNEYRAKIVLSSTELGPRCNLHPESIIHVLRDCPKSTKFWSSLIHITKYHIFLYLIARMAKEQRGRYWQNGNSFNQRPMSLFTAVVWHVWKARNEEIFERTTFSPYKICMLASIYATDM